MSLIKIQVNTANQKYPIYIGNNILNKLNKFLKNHFYKFKSLSCCGRQKCPQKID